MQPVSNWTEERVELLKKLWAEGLSCSKIAAELGAVTRNAVIGKVSRLGLPTRKIAVPRAARAPRVRIRNLGNAGMVFSRRPKFDAEPYIPLEEIEIPEAQRKTLQQLTDKTCRWPVGDPQDEDFFFCGGEVGPGACKPYCRAHARIAYNRPINRPPVQDLAAAERLRRRAHRAAQIAEAVAA